MKLTYVETVPEKRRGRHSLQDVIEEFVHSGQKVAQVIFNEADYKSPMVCRSCLATAAKRSRHPVKVALRGDEVFLIRKF